ncbi:MAG: GNAT family N-acetyltransferase [Candidatus Woesearchaeota archaeon]
MKLVTKRLILRPVNKNDVSDIVENINNIKVSRYMSLIPYPYVKKDAYSWINRKEKKNNGNIADYTFVIEHKKDKKVIGALGLHRVDYDAKKAELGYWLGEKHWGNHYMSEAVQAIIKFGFGKLKMKRIHARVFSENIPSARLLEKFGFKQEGLMRKSGFSKATKKIHDEKVYGLLKEESRKI